MILWRLISFTLKFLASKKKLYMPEANLAIVVSPEQPDGTALLLEPSDSLNAKEFQQTTYNAGLPLWYFLLTIFKKNLRD